MPFVAAIIGGAIGGFIGMRFAKNPIITGVLGGLIGYLMSWIIPI